MLGAETEVAECCGLARYGISTRAVCALSAAHHDGGASHLVAGSDDTIFRQQENAARTLYLPIDILYAVHEVLTFHDKQTYQLRGVDTPAAELAQVHILLQEVLHQFLGVVDFADRTDGETPEMGVEEQGLRIGIGDDAYASIAAETCQLVLKLCPKGGVLNAVDDALESVLRVKSSHSRTPCAEMAVIIRAVEHIGYARRRGYFSKETCHDGG